ncbi:hypothetical protein Pcinc_006575 [Petrolisthes cinctipes]|uniref:Uncharacterized protein n=1 Tax=Petrolisthes cinctipes TaxID=88211 RepID=A0AAE1GAE5_PETCI|nr:hypothetical protein Pcinc_006575 [Petrolisthes cinctipes]
MWKPEETWSVYSIRTLAKCCDYSAGRVLARKAEHASDIISDGEYGRGCRRIKRVHRESEDSESDSTSRPNQRSLPEPPEIQFEETNNPKLTNVMVKGVMTMAVELMTIILKATMILKIQMVVTVNLLM